MSARRITTWSDRVDVWAVTVAGVDHRVEIDESLLNVTIAVDGAPACRVPRRPTLTGAFRQEIAVGATRVVVHRPYPASRFQISSPDVADRALEGGGRRALQGLAAAVIGMSSFFLWKMSQAPSSTCGLVFTVVLLALMLAAAVFIYRRPK